MNLFKFLFSKEDEATNDKLGAYPEKVHVAAMPERRYLKTSRVMTIVAVGMLCGVIILALILYMLAPQLHAVPGLYYINKQFYRLSPVQRSVVVRPVNALILEMYIREYIMLRYTILADVDEMNRRWSKRSDLFWYSSEDAFKGFQPEQAAMSTRMMEGMTREVRVRFVSYVWDGLWLAEFDTIDKMPEEEKPRIRRWRAQIRAGFMARGYPNADERMKNPLNFMVFQFDISSRGINEPKVNANFVD
ncbi:unknown [Acetobacter sp. CAG:977]|nr:unknown [Acetobacter sp. CAG:977]